jgi:Uma2 family endonuclease
MATQPASTRRWTYTEFARLPDDGNRYEVIAGELHMTPAPRPIHQKIVARLCTALDLFSQEHKLGEVFPGPIDVVFAEGDYLEPDLVFVRRDRRGIISDRGIEGAPDLVVEVVSASTAVRDRNLKRERYAWFGVPEYWVVDAEAGHIEVYRMLEDPTTPRIDRDTLVWRLAPGAPALSISVPEVLRGLE